MEEPCVYVTFLKLDFPRSLSPHDQLKQDPFFELLHLYDFSFKEVLGLGSLSSNSIPIGQILQGLIFPIIDPPENLLVLAFELKLNSF